jgi:protein-tyrosine-phosphatase
MPLRVLILCTGNSACSQTREGISASAIAKKIDSSGGTSVICAPFTRLQQLDFHFESVSAASRIRCF